LKAMVRPVREIAEAVQRQDAKWLTSLPGVGAATAEQIITSLRRKVTRFALAAPEPNGTPGAAPAAPAAPAPGAVGANLFEDAYQALMSVGLSPIDARTRLDQLVTSGRKFTAVDELLHEAFRTETPAKGAKPAKR